MMTAFHLLLHDCMCFPFYVIFFYFFCCIFVRFVFILCIPNQLPSCKCRRPDHSSSLVDTYNSSQQRFQFPFWHRIWIFDMIADVENCLDPNTRLCQRRVKWLLPVYETEKITNWIKIYEKIYEFGWKMIITLDVDLPMMLSPSS